MSKVVLDVGGHTGDLILALPVAQAIKEQGMDVRVRILPRYYKPAECFGIPNQPYYRGKAIKLLSGDNRHRTDAWLAAAKKHRLKLDPVRAPTSVIPNKGLLPGDGWILLQPWCEWGAKHWPIEKWMELAGVLTRQGHKVAVAGPQVFRKRAGLIPATNLCGLDKDSWPATIAAASLVISVDSGAVHMADAIGIPCVSLYSDAMPVSVWAPYWDRSRVISKPSMRDITVADVMEKADG